MVKAIVFLIVFLSSVTPSWGGEMTHVKTVDSYRRSGEAPYWMLEYRPTLNSRWTPEEIVGLLREYPTHYVSISSWGAWPPGNSLRREMHRIVNETQALACRMGEPELADRLLTGLSRADVAWKYRSGYHACQICDRSGTCRDRCGWAGTMKSLPTFDPAWIMRVPRSEHRWSVDRIWGGDEAMDPWEEKGATRWPEWFDKEAVAAVNDEDHVAVLYGRVEPIDREGERAWAPKVSAVVMDLRIPEYRNWIVRRMLHDLETTGFDPGERFGFAIGYKPGWHTFYHGPPSGDRCFVPDSHAWTGPASKCDERDRPAGGPYDRTQYGPGEFEAALNNLLREIHEGLEGDGYKGIPLITVERPRFKAVWEIIDEENRNAEWLLGEMSTSCDRRDLSQPPDPIRCE